MKYLGLSWKVFAGLLIDVVQLLKYEAVDVIGYQKYSIL